MNEARGAVTRYVQIGTTSLIICGIGVAINVMLAVWLDLTRIAPAHETNSMFLIAFLILLVGAMVATLTIEVDDRSVSWYFSGRILYRRVAFSDLAAIEPHRIAPWNFGYRIGYKKRAWIVTGTGSIVLEDSRSEMQFLVGCDDPEAVCAEIERRYALATQEESDADTVAHR